MKRVLTAVILTPIALAALFLLPPYGFSLFVAAFIVLAVVEFVAIARPRAANAPLSALVVLAPLAAFALIWSMSGAANAASVADTANAADPRLPLLSAGLFLAVGLGTLVLLTGTPGEEVIPALGILGFGTAYFALPIVSLHFLKAQDPWLVVLLMAIVWLGDTAAFYVGSKIGRHRMAPSVSPKKSWEGAIASLVTAVAAAAVWSAFRLGHVDAAILGLAGLVSIAAQIGDLVESLIKRGAGVKDSGHILPGHGGVLDRLDATLFAAPVLLVGLWLLGHDSLAP